MPPTPEYTLLVSNVGWVVSYSQHITDYDTIKALFDEYVASGKYEQVSMWSDQEDDPIEEYNVTTSEEEQEQEPMQLRLIDEPKEDAPKTLPPGTLVVCTYRLPLVNQPWIHEVYIGVVEEPGTNPADWNKHNSEAYYCEVHNKARIRYEWGVAHDSRDSLLPVTPEHAALSFREKIGVFLGEEALRTFDKSCDGVL